MVFFPKTQNFTLIMRKTNPNSEIFYKICERYSSKNYWGYGGKKYKERWIGCHQPEETGRTWQLNAICYPGLNYET